MTRFMELAKEHYPRSDANTVSNPKYRDTVIVAIHEFFTQKPPIEDYIYDYMLMLLSLNVIDRLYVQRAVHPLAQKYDNLEYMKSFSRALQHTDVWVDINAVTDHERRPLPDKGLILSTEFTLP